MTAPPPSAIAVIPARFGAARFPGKPLADDTGKPLVVHVVERVRAAEMVERVLVATDDTRIAEAVRAAGAEAVMTGEHPNGTARIAEAVDRIGLDDPEAIIVNVQGDEPEIPVATIDTLVRGLAADADAPMATLASPFGADEDPSDPNLVKVLVDRRGLALLFSRARIPFDRDGSADAIEGAAPLKHPGLYAYRRRFLAVYPTLAPTPAEQAEKLEQLRALEHGYPIRIIPAPAPHPGIDTPAQYAAFVRRVHAATGADVTAPSQADRKPI